jgi:hypothetical protein
MIRKGYTMKCIKTASKELKRDSILKMKKKCLTNNKKNKTNHKCNILFELKKGTLTKFGYSMKNSKSKRHISLKKAMKIIKPLSVYRKLNALYILNKNRHPLTAKLFKNDAEWLKNKI